MLNVTICKTWVTCVWALLDHSLHFSLYFKIFDDFSWKGKGVVKTALEVLISS